MKAITKNLIICLLFLSGGQLFGQDIHFTQFYESPVYLNPAYAGHIEGTYRVAAIYRSQWGSIIPGGAFVTQGVSGDFNLGLKDSGNSFGIGLQFLGDQTGEGTFNNLGGLVSLAYHMGLDRKKHHYLSIGVQGGIMNQRVDVSNITFGDQLIDPAATPESFENESVFNPDLNVGLAWSSYFNKKIKIKVGGTYFHILESKNNLLGGEFVNPARFAVHMESDFVIAKGIHLKPHAYYTSQASASELNAGLVLGYDFSYDLHLFVGGGTRIQDAAYGLAGLDYKGIRLGFGYDINTSDLKAVSSGVGGFEISLGYTGTIFKKADPILPAIRFF